VPTMSGERTSPLQTQPWGRVHKCEAPRGNEVLLVSGPLHQRGRRHHRRARAIHSRERGQVSGPQPPQHLRPGACTHPLFGST